MRTEDQPDRDEKDARRKSPQEWLELAALGRRHWRRLAQQQEQLRKAVLLIGDEYADYRDRINRVVLPGIQDDLDEAKRQIRKAELFAEYSGRGSKKSRQTR